MSDEFMEASLMSPPLITEYMLRDWYSDSEDKRNITMQLLESDYVVEGSVIDWNGNVIGYEIDNGLSGCDLDIFNYAVDMISNYTCIQFVQAQTGIGSGDQSRITVKKSMDDGCRVTSSTSHVSIQIGRLCVYKGQMIHLLLHALGFDHNQMGNESNVLSIMSTTLVYARNRDKLTVEDIQYINTKYQCPMSSMDGSFISDDIMHGNYTHLVDCFVHNLPTGNTLASSSTVVQQSSSSLGGSFSKASNAKKIYYIFILTVGIIFVIWILQYITVVINRSIDN
jgi:Astacin (Peptidase family M12A)